MAFPQSCAGSLNAGSKPSPLYTLATSNGGEPSASNAKIAPGYESTTIKLKDGKTKTLLIGELSEAAGTAGGMIGGQVADLEGEGRPPDAGILYRPSVYLPILGLAALALLPVIYQRWRARTGREAI